MLWALAVTLGLLLVLVGALRFFSRTAAPIEGLRAYAQARGALARGDGVATALEVMGTIGLRRWTLGYQHPPGQPAVLLVGVDCAAAPGRADASGPHPTLVDDEVLAARITEPTPDLFDIARLDALLASMDALAQRLERERPADEAPE